MGVLTAGAYARPGVHHRLALDLGTSAVRLWTAATDEMITEPAVLCRPGNGRHVAGHAALSARTAATRTWPVREGVVRDFFACVHLLRLLAADLGLPPDDPYPLLVGVPATATLRQRNLLVAAVRRALGGRVVAVEEPLAAALACRPDPGGDDLIVVDIGSGRTEVARIHQRSVTAAERVEHADPVDRIPPIADSVRRLGGIRPDGVRRLIITGGGAAAPGVAARLAALTGLSVTVPADPPMATLTGLRRLLTG